MNNSSILVKFKWLIILVTLAGLVGSLIFVYLKPAYYDTSIAFSINRTIIQDTEEYQYDGYYAIQAADLFSQTVMSWFLTPSVLLEIYEKAGIDPEISSIEEITSRFKARKYSPQNIVVRYKERDSETATKIATAIISVIEHRGSLANQTIDEQSLFEVKGATPVIVKRTPVIWLVGLIGLISGFVLSTVAAYSIEYLRSSGSRRNDEA
ncbi:hypothetical protein IID19_01555 [Patescibacteria group bacterium]|nr:hypothetical protein [Patescibacteria group bacterium]